MGGIVSVPTYPAPGPGYLGPAPRSRPTIVTVAAYLLYAVAVLQVINAIAAFATYSTLRDAIQNAYAGTELEGSEGLVAGVAVAGGVVNLLLGLGFVALGYFDSKGKNPARIVTWVVGGISLCCLGLGLGSNALVGTVNTDTSGTTSDEVQRRVNDALPGWYNGVTTTLSVLGLLVILAVVILLALPASNEYFRKPAANGWNPPYPGYPGGQPQGYPGGQYPAYPAYPPQQGQPGQPAPGLPPYPGQQTPPPYPGQQAPPYPGQPGPYPGQMPPTSDPYAPGGAAPPPGPYVPPPVDPTAAPPQYGQPYGQPQAQPPVDQPPAQPPFDQPPSERPETSADPSAPPAADGEQPPKPPTNPA